MKNEEGNHLFDPQDIKELFEKRVDLIIDGGLGGDVPLLSWIVPSRAGGD
ncbi:MAG: hypothetical protein R2879_03740 [Saprospiraceae bacterium]